MRENQFIPREFLSVATTIMALLGAACTHAAPPADVNRMPEWKQFFDDLKKSRQMSAPDCSNFRLTPERFSEAISMLISSDGLSDISSIEHLLNAQFVIHHSVQGGKAYEAKSVLGESIPAQLEIVTREQGEMPIVRLQIDLRPIESCLQLSSTQFAARFRKQFSYTPVFDSGEFSGAMNLQTDSGARLFISYSYRTASNLVLLIRIDRVP